MTISKLATPYQFKSFSNYSQNREGAKIDKIVIHHMATTSYDSVPSVWRTRPASAHYGIGKQGEIRAYLDEENVAWHAGDWQANVTSIGIEHCNTTGAPTWDIAQATIEASVKLCADIAKRYKLGKLVPYKNLYPHSSFIATACPGQLKAKLQYIADKANAINNGGGEIVEKSTVKVHYTGKGKVRLMDEKGKYIDQYVADNTAWKVVGFNPHGVIIGKDQVLPYKYASDLNINDMKLIQKLFK